MKRRNNITKKNAPPPSNVQRQQSLGGSIMEGVASGITFGAGSSIGHRAMDSIFGPRKIEVDSKIETISENNSCKLLKETYEKCLKENSWEVSTCEDFRNLLQTLNC